MAASDTGLPLSGGTIPTLSPDASLAQTITALNEIITNLNNQLQSQIYSDGTNKRFLLGYQQGGWPKGDFGMKISLPGVDVNSATLDQLLFYWDFTSGTQYWFDPTTGKNYLQEGILPDGIGGWAVASAGNNVADGFS